MIKLRIREKSLSFAAAKKRKTLYKQHELEEKIALLEKELEQPTAVSKTQETNKTEQLELFKSLLEEIMIIKVRTQGAILRSKIKWYNEGEKNTKSFLNLEKRHFKMSTISQLKSTDQEFVTSDKEILAECETFYKELYTSQKNVIPTEKDLFLKMTRL